MLLSESCVPLRTFQFVQRYLLSNSKSYLDMFPDDQVRKREPGKMTPARNSSRALMQPYLPTRAWKEYRLN